MTIPVTVGVGCVFEDRVDLVVREAGAVRVSLRLSRAAAFALSARLRRVDDGERHSLCDIPATLDYPESLPAGPSEDAA